MYVYVLFMFICNSIKFWQICPRLVMRRGPDTNAQPPSLLRHHPPHRTLWTPELSLSFVFLIIIQKIRVAILNHDDCRKPCRSNFVETESRVEEKKQREKNHLVEQFLRRQRRALGRIGQRWLPGPPLLATPVISITIIIIAMILMLMTAMTMNADDRDPNSFFTFQGFSVEVHLPFLHFSVEVHLPGRRHAGVVEETSTVGHQHCCHCPCADSPSLLSLAISN